MNQRITQTAAGRALVCALLVFALCAPQFQPEFPELHREQPLQILPPAVSSPSVLAKAEGPRVDHARYRTASTPVVAVLPVETPDWHGGRMVAPAADVRQPSRWAARTLSGRSPPLAIS